MPKGMSTCCQSMSFPENSHLEHVGRKDMLCVGGVVQVIFFHPCYKLLAPVIWKDMLLAVVFPFYQVYTSTFTLRKCLRSAGRMWLGCYCPQLVCNHLLNLKQELAGMLFPTTHDTRQTPAKHPPNTHPIPGESTAVYYLFPYQNTEKNSSAILLKVGV